MISTRQIKYLGTMRSAGRGKRSTMAHVPELNNIVTAMGARIRELEQALATARGHVLDMQRSIDTVLSTPMLTRTEPSFTTTQRGPGSFNVNACGDAVYFGPTAGSESLLSFEGASVNSRSRFPFTPITESFPFSSEKTPWDEDLALLQLSAHLPSEERAWRLCETYYRNGCWTGMPIMQSEIVELLTLVYDNIPSEEQYEPATLTQKMAGLFFVFCAWSLGRPQSSSVQPEADRYFDLACAGMSIKPLFENPNVVTVQALTLLACYYSHGGPRFTMDGAWSTISLASRVSQRLGLREPFASTVHIVLTVEQIAKNRLHIPSQVLESSSDRQARWRGTKEVTAPIMEKFLKATRPDYDDVLDMDQRIRKYIHSCPFQRFPSLVDEPPFAYIQRNLVPLLSKTMILYIHSRYFVEFVETIREKPTNPISSSYSASFLAAYLSASGIIEGNKRNFTIHPELFTRWWSSWKSLFHAAGSFSASPQLAIRRKMATPTLSLGLLPQSTFSKRAQHPHPPLDPEIQRDIDIFVCSTRIIGGKRELQRALGALTSRTENADTQAHAPVPAPATNQQEPTPQSLDSYLQQILDSPNFDYLPHTSESGLPHMSSDDTGFFVPYQPAYSADSGLAANLKGCADYPQNL
ncbi:hypothetical protein C8R47DRAFT_1329035 [Mycena vitilis]|nr:hypothetical protein C8R47DRAFT_1329035 [Mycena vitilis]